MLLAIIKVIILQLYSSPSGSQHGAANVNYADISDAFTISSNSHISKIPATLLVLSASQQPTYNTNINMKYFQTMEQPFA